MFHVTTHKTPETLKVTYRRWQSLSRACTVLSDPGQATVNPTFLGRHLRHPVHDLVLYLLDLFPVTPLFDFRNVEGDVSPLAHVEQGLHATESDLVFDGSRQVVDLCEAQDDVVSKVSGQQFPVALVQLVVVGREAQVESNNEEEGDGSRRHDQLLPLPEPPLRAGVVPTQVEHVRRVDHLMRKKMQQVVIKLGKAVQREPRLNRCEVCELRHVEENVGDLGSN